MEDKRKVFKDIFYKSYLNYLQENRDVTIEELAGKIGVAYGSFCKYLSKDILIIPNAIQLDLIEKFFKIDLSECYASTDKEILKFIKKRVKLNLNQVQLGALLEVKTNIINNIENCSDVRYLTAYQKEVFNKFIELQIAGVYVEKLMSMVDGKITS